MLLDTICAVALYCQRCGQVHIQDVPYFIGQGERVLRCPNCSHEQAEIALRPQKGLVLRIPCGVCGTENRFGYSMQQLRKLRFEKIYCHGDQFELGYIGRWQTIAEFLDFNAAEFDALHPGEGDNFMAKQQILLEAVNRVHDLAEARQFSCPCGSHEFSAGIVEDSILLECVRCGSYAMLRAECTEDLQRLLPGMELNVLQPDMIWNR